MSDWLTRNRQELRNWATRLKEVAPFSMKKLMKAAGLTRQTLDYWSSGRSAPEPENMLRVGFALTVRAEKLQSLGRELIEQAKQEEDERRAARPETRPVDELSLFQTGTG